MTTADLVMESALALAQSGTDTDEAVATLLERSGERRVSVVMAHRYLVDKLAHEPTDQTARAAELVQAALGQLGDE